MYGDETDKGADTGGGYIAKPSFCLTSNRNLHILAGGGVQERDFLMSNWGSVCSDNLLKLKLVALINTFLLQSRTWRIKGVNKLRTYSRGGIECASRKFFSSEMRFMWQRKLSLNKCESLVLLLNENLKKRGEVLQASTFRATR